MPSSDPGEAEGEIASGDEPLSKHPKNLPEVSPVDDSEKGVQPTSTDDGHLEDGNADDHTGDDVRELTLDSAEDPQDDYPQFACEFEAPSQEQVEALEQTPAGISSLLPLPLFPPEPPAGSPARSPPPSDREPLRRKSNANSNAVRSLLPTSSARLTAAHRAELLRHATFFQERRQQLLDEIHRERQATSISRSTSAGKLTGADAEAMIENHHERILQIVFSELDMEVGRALAHASSLFTRIELVTTGANGAAGDKGPPGANLRAGEPSVPAPPPPPQSPSWTNGVLPKAQRDDRLSVGRSDMPPIERRLSTGSRLPAPPLLPLPASRAQPDSTGEWKRSGSPRGRSRSRSGPRLPPPPPKPIGAEAEGDGTSQRFVADVCERSVNGKQCWQAEIMQPGGATRRGSERTYAVRAPQRRSREEAEADAQKLTDASVDGPKAVRLVAGDLARKK